MHESKYDILFSSERMNKYYLAHPGNKPKALFLYEANIELSQSLYTPLSVLEVALRNAICKQLVRKAGNNPEWYTDWYKNPILYKAYREINGVIARLLQDNKPCTPADIVAQLTFGFWTALFNQPYERELWGNLMFAFPHLPKHQRQRKTIETPLNNIRKRLRNRVYHYEPICWNLANLQNDHLQVLQLIEWMDTDLYNWVRNKDTFPNTLSNVNTQLSRL